MIRTTHPWINVGLALILAACGGVGKPTITLSATPTTLDDGQVITLKADAKGGQGALKVEFFLEQSTGTEKVGEDSSSPFELNYTALTNDDATFSFTAKAIAADSQFGVSEPVSVQVKADKTAPQVGLTASSSNLNSSGNVTLTANATDNKGVVKVEFFKGVTKLGEDTTPADGFKLVVNLTAEDNGALKYTAKAHDAKGNVGTSEEVAVLVDIDVTSLKVSLSSDNNSLSAPGSITLTATASDDKGVVKVEFYRGNTKINQDTTSEDGFSFQVHYTESRQATDGWSAKAYDANGNIGTSNMVEIVVDIDITNPTLAFSTNPEKLTTLGDLTLTVENSDNHKVVKLEMYRKGPLDAAPVLLQSWNNPAASVSKDVSIALQHIPSVEFIAKAYDAKNNTSSLSKTIEVEIKPGILKFEATSGSSLSVGDAGGTVDLIWDGEYVQGYSLETSPEGASVSINAGASTAGKITLPANLTNADKSYTLTLRAKGYGNPAFPDDTKQLTITVAKDTTLPNISLSKDPATTLLGPGEVKLSAAASDAAGIQKVEFFKGTTLIATDTTAPYQYTLNFTFSDNGTHSYIAKTIDINGNSKESSVVEVSVNIATGFMPAEIVAGSYHACGIALDGKAYCWGYNAYGQLGIGISDNNHNSPKAVSLPTGVTALSHLTAGAGHTCGLGSDGKAYCWGLNNNGQLGNANNSNYNTPQAMSLPPGVASFSQMVAKGARTCGLGSDGNAYCWGAGGNGELGNGTNTNSNTPQAVSLPSGAPANFTFNQLSVGTYHTCGIGSDGKTYCWGQNQYGQLGNGSTTSSNTPQAVNLPPGVTSFSQLTAGHSHTCGISLDSKAYCWGYNAYGQLGTGDNTDFNTPQAVSLPSAVTGFSYLVAGYYHTCGIGLDGKAYCWGYNTIGSLGNGTTDASNTPVEVSLPVGNTALTRLTAGWGYTCGIGSYGNAYCWGFNGLGQLGIGNRTNSSTPVLVPAP